MNKIEKESAEKWWYIIAGVLGSAAILGVAVLQIPDKSLILLAMTVVVALLVGWLMFK